MKHEERVSELVGDFHPSVVTGLQFAINVLENLTGDHGPLFPRGMLVRQLFTFKVGLNSVMVNVEKIARHAGAMSLSSQSSS
jgi:hypothetical protein